jgi:hypothetical protein
MSATQITPPPPADEATLDLLHVRATIDIPEAVHNYNAGISQQQQQQQRRRLKAWIILSLVLFSAAIGLFELVNKLQHQDIDNHTFNKSLDARKSSSSSSLLPTLLSALNTVVALAPIWSADVVSSSNSSSSIASAMSSTTAA